MKTKEHFLKNFKNIQRKRDTLSLKMQKKKKNELPLHKKLMDTRRQMSTYLKC